MAIDYKSLRQIEQHKKLGDGGEASIYERDPKTVIKVFNSKVDLAKKEAKVRHLISIQKQLPRNVIGPQEIVTIQGRFAGYAMRKLPDAEDLHMLTKPKYLTAARLSNQDVLQIVTGVGIDLGKLHSNSVGILVGDVSDYNFQMNGKCNYFVDTDSWGVVGKFTPDAYTELFTCPDSYTANGNVVFSLEDEHYNFAVLAFNMLTRIHPFGGTYLPDKNLSTVQRMKKRISVVGAHKGDIKIPKIIGSWKWMSPKLERDFIEIFEQGKKFDITPDLQDLLKNMKYCSVHDIYYYSQFNECPLCNANAKVKATPTITHVAQTSNGPQLTIVFSGTDCAYILSSRHYLNQSRQAVHFETGWKVTVPIGKRVDFSQNGEFMYVTDDDTIEVYDTQLSRIATIDRMHKTNIVMSKQDIYYVDKGNNLIKLAITQHGNMPTYLGQVYHPLFEVAEDGSVFCASMYPKTAVITTQDYTFKLNYTGKIGEYAIKHDPVTKAWLFVYQMPNGKYRTLVFNKKQVTYDDDVILYNAQPLSNIDFYNGTIYDPADSIIVGTNISKNVAKEFKCHVVDESSKLQFTGRSFKIYNKSNIYNFG